MERKYKKMEDNKTIAEMNAEADDKLIAWSLKMVREGRVDFGKHSDDMAAYLDSWFRIPFVDQFMSTIPSCGYSSVEMMIIRYDERPFAAHLWELLGFDAPDPDEYDWSQLHYADILMKALAVCSRKRKASRCDMVVYGLLLYAFRCTGKWNANEKEYRFDFPMAFGVDTSSYFAKTAKVFLTALVRGWDFPDDSKDYPIEFLVELADAVE